MTFSLPLSNFSLLEWGAPLSLYFVRGMSTQNHQCHIVSQTLVKAITDKLLLCCSLELDKTAKRVLGLRQRNYEKDFFFLISDVNIALMRD